MATERCASFWSAEKQEVNLNLRRCLPPAINGMFPKYFSFPTKTESDESGILNCRVKCNTFSKHRKDQIEQCYELILLELVSTHGSACERGRGRVSS